MATTDGRQSSIDSFEYLHFTEFHFKGLRYAHFDREYLTRGQILHTLQFPSNEKNISISGGSSRLGKEDPSFPILASLTHLMFQNSAQRGGGYKGTEIKYSLQRGNDQCSYVYVSLTAIFVIHVISG